MTIYNGTTQVRYASRPKDLDWNARFNEPNVTQSQFESENWRISYNPDDNRFYLEEKDNEYGDWHTRQTHANTTKGWDNAKYHYRKMLKQ